MVGRSRGLSMWSGVARLTSSCRSAWSNLRAGVRQRWRVWRGRCVVCNGAHVSVGGWPKTSHLCGWCVKRLRHGLHYGMGAEKMKQTLELH